MAGFGAAVCPGLAAACLTLGAALSTPAAASQASAWFRGGYRGVLPPGWETENAALFFTTWATFGSH